MMVIQAACRIALVAIALVAGAASAVRADPLEAKLGVSIDILSGDHEINLGRRDQLHWVPLPLGEFTVRHGRDALRVEGMPPLSSTYGTASSRNSSSVRLSILNATYRRELGSGWFVGAGQTVYNQATTGLPSTYQTAQYSRVTGARWEIGRLATTGRDRVEAWASFNPVMHGLGHTQYAGFTVCNFPPQGSIALPSCRTSNGSTVNDGESAGQVDLSARIAHAVSKRGELMYGIRYLNYSAHYDRAPGSIADRNVGFAPTIGYRTRL